MIRNLRQFLLYSLFSIILLVVLPFLLKEKFVVNSTQSIGGYTVANQRNAAASRSFQSASASDQMIMVYIFIGLLVTSFAGWIFMQWYTNTGFFEKKLY